MRLLSTVMDASPSTSDTSYISIDLDSSILHQVQKAIHRFAAATRQEESEGEDELPIPTPIATLPGRAPELTLEEKKCEYEYQVKSLEAEIRLLEDELKRRDQPLNDITDEQLEQAIFSVSQPSESGAQAVDQPSSTDIDSSSTNSDDQRQLESLRSQIRLSEGFSGIKLNNVSWEITHKDGRGLFRKHTHSGTAHGFSFQVQFIVREEKVSSDEGEPINQARIIALRPRVDPQLRSEMQVFLKRVATDCDLMNFYRTFVKCCQYVLERQSTFSKIVCTHGEKVLSSGVHGTRMNFAFDNGCRLLFTWSVIVSDHGHVDHSISLQTKASANATEEQREGLSHLPHLLQRIILAHGHGQGIVEFLSILADPTSHSESTT